MGILNTPWRWTFFAFSMLARLPLSMVTVIFLLGAATGEASIGEVGLLVGAIALGSSVSGFAQGPAFSRFGYAGIYFLLSVLAASLLVLIALNQGEQAALMFALCYGLVRPHTSTVVRSVWIDQFPGEQKLANRAVALDIGASPMLGIIGPLLAGLLVALTSVLYATFFVAIGGLVTAAGLSLLIVSSKHRSGRKAVAYLDPLRRLLRNKPLLTVLLLAVLQSIGSGAAVVLIAAQLEITAHSGWLTPILAISAAAIAFGTYLFRKVLDGIKRHFRALLLLEACCFVIYGLAFMSPAEWLWILVPLASLPVAPLATSFYLLAESHSAEEDRPTAFSIVASAQFAGVAIGQSLFSQIAENRSPSFAAFSAALVIFLAAVAWSVASHGHKTSRPAI